MAHDFNNLLTCILGYADIIAEAPQRADEVAKAADIIAKTARSAFDLTHQLLGFARKGELQVRAIDVHRVIDDTLALLRRTVDHSIVLTAKLQAPSPVIYGDPSQIQQVLMNIAVNARDALPQGGEIVVKTSNVRLDEESSRLYPRIGPGRYLEISMRDNGIGMTEDVRRRIFEPFFTTKDAGKGTGMGLVIVYNIVKNHGGAVTVLSAPDRGTEFKVFLPSADAASVAEDPVAQEAVLGSGRIMVVDDEEDVREVIGSMLRRSGYAVEFAANGREGLDIFRREHANIDLVILDLDMPVMGGLECFRGMKEIDPSVLALVATGYGLEASADTLLSEGVAHLLHKPFDRARLSEIVAQLLVRQ
jgi:CheY-like chemotaxis protein